MVRQRPTTEAVYTKYTEAQSVAAGFKLGGFVCAEEGKLELPMVLALECKNPQVFFCKTKTSKATKGVFKTTNHLPHILCAIYP